MRKSFSPFAIGLFVFGAVALFVAIILIFGTSQFLAPKMRYVTFFKGSVSGLDIGAPVTFRGVRVGTVASISLKIDPETKNIVIPVLIDIEPDQVDGQPRSMAEAYRGVETLVTRGLRAQLAMQSFLTGKLYIELAIHPEAEPAQVIYDGRYPQLPTIVSEFDVLADTLKRLPVDRLFDRALGAIEGIERLVNDRNVVATLQSAKKATQSLDSLLGDLSSTLTQLRSLSAHLDEQIGGLADGYRDVALETKTLIQHTDRRVAALAAQLDTTLAAASATFATTDALLADTAKIIDPDSPLLFEFRNTLQELGAASRAVRVLADYLERHPGALLHGKQNHD